MKRFSFFLILILILASCKEKKKEIPKIDPGFTSYISGFTSGVISANASISVRLMQEVSESVREEVLTEKLFEFKPSIEGNINWLNNRIVEFRPEQPLPPGTVFNAFFHLSRLTQVPGHLETLEFQFQTMQQAVYVNFEGLKSVDEENLKWQQLSGTLKTADVANSESVEKVLGASQNNKPLNIKWNHGEEGRIHEFVVDSITRSEGEEEIKVIWDGRGIGSEDKGEQIIDIPPLGDFKLMNLQVAQQPDQYVGLYFSDPVSRNQDLRGLIYFETGEEVNLEIKGNQVKVYSADRLQGAYNLVIDESLKNSLDYRLVEGYRKEIVFTSIKPDVELVGDGVILPQSNGLIFPFKAVNLKAVNVRIIKIFEDNVAQFLQVNQYDGDNGLTRVGRIIFKGEIPIVSDKPIDYGSWNIFSLDLADLIKTEPGAIYNVSITFDQSQSLYQCPGEDESEQELTPYTEDRESDRFDGPEDYYYYHYYDYNWRDRDDPCTHSYYNYRKNRNGASRNVLASDLGIIAKGGDGTDLFVAVTNLLDAEPIAGVKIEIYNYQNQLIEETTTDNQGMAGIPLERKPFLLVAKHGTQRGYLRLDDGSALSTSMFDVGGSKNIEGIKGFLYGERGVWRPGDSLYLTFILEDKNKVLPEDHPVRFELYTPENQLYLKKIRTTSVNGMYDFRTATEGDAPTGNWLAKIIVGGSRFTKTIRIETVKPNRLKINIDFEKDILSKGSNIGTLNAKWLHGAIAKKLKADIEMNLTSTRTTFKEYNDYVFDDPSKSFEADEQMIYDGQLDSLGNVKFLLKINVGDEAPGMLQAFLKTRVFENSGDFSVDRFPVLYSPFKRYVGVKVPEGPGWNGALYSNEPNLISIVTVDESGAPVDVKDLKIEIYDVRWRWWWEREDYNDLASYIRNRSQNLVRSDKISTVNGKAIYEMKFNRNLWGRMLIRISDPEGGHSTGKTFYLSYRGWWSTPGQDNPGGAEMLTFTTDKKDYAVGENIRVNLPEFREGRALISIESGSQIIETFWLEAQDIEKPLTIPATEKMAPNAFIHVSLIQPYKKTINDLPIRLYGIQSVNVVDKRTQIYPVLTMPDVLEPEQEVTLKVSERDGRRMTYTVAVVDEGLLDLTRFKTPDPWNSFYSKEALGIRTWDMYKYVMGAFTGEMAGLFSVGGDEFIKQDDTKNTTRFKPVVRFLGPFELREGKTNSHSFTMPNYVGSVKTMVVARDEGAYGNTEKATPVKKPLMLLATLPRMVSPAETVSLPVNVFSMDEKVKDVSVEVRTNDLFTLAEPAAQRIAFAREGDQLLYFTLKVAKNIGAGKVEVLARSGNLEAKDIIDLQVRLPNPRITKLIDDVVEAGKTWESGYDAVGLTGTNKGVIEVSAIPRINLEQRLKFLMQYPYGCIEQTTSAVFPQLYLDRFVELESEQKSKIQDNIIAGINKIKSFQISDGGLTYWPGSYGSANEWCTSYAGHFMLEAKAKGYKIPIGFIDNWVTYQSRKANSWNRETGWYGYRRSSEINQAYRLYTLALAKKPALGAMNRLREMRDLSVAARWRLAGAYLLIGKKEVAEQIVSGLTTTVDSYSELSYTYGSSMRDQAMILEVVTMLGDNATARRLMEELAELTGSGQWCSTQSTAFALLSIGKFLGESGTAGGIEFECTVNGKKTATASTAPIAQVNLPFSGGKGGTISLKNTGDRMLFISVQLEGIPLTEGRVDDEKDLRMVVRYLNMNEVEIDPAELEQGTDFIAEVRLIHPGIRVDYKEMALTQMFASGWEIRNLRLDNINPAILKDEPRYQDIRDDRVYTYFDLDKGKSKTFRVMLNAAYLGEYYLPAVYCEAMYDNSIHATKTGKWVKVVRQR